MDYDIIKYDAGDIRNKSIIENITKHNMSDKNIMSLFNNKIRRIAIIMDEIDGMNNGDKGGINSLIKLIRPKKTKKQKLEEVSMNPIICIGNYHIDKKIKELMKVCNVIELKTPSVTQISGIIKTLIPTIEDNIKTKIVNYVQGDIRKLKNIYSIYNFTSYNYYRLIVTKTISDTTLSIADISLGGNTNTSFTPLDNYNILLYNTNEKQFPPRPWDNIDTTNEYSSSNELFNVTPASYFKQVLTYNNHGTYTIYSSSTITGQNYSKHLLFNHNTGDLEGAHWLGNNYSSSTGNYTNTTTNATIGLNNNYRGDWIIVKFPFVKYFLHFTL